MKKLAIDIDDTLNCSYLEGNLSAMTIAEEYGHTYTFDPTKEHESDRYQLPKDLADIWWKKYFPLQVRNSIVMPHAIATIERLQRIYDVYIMTSRNPDYNGSWQPYKGRMMVADTNQWFEKNKIPISSDHRIYGIKNKGEMCEKMGFSVLIDNSPKHIISAMEHNIKAIVIGYPYNEEFGKQNKNELLYLPGVTYCDQWKRLHDSVSKL